MGYSIKICIALLISAWETRTGEDDLKGKILAVFPEQPRPATATGFFTKTPRRQTALAVEGLKFSPILGLAKRPWWH